MPLIKRETQPKSLSLGTIDSGIQNELECVTNNTLANVLRQLSSLSKNAEDMFGELFNEANLLYNRAVRLSDRVENLKFTVTQLDSGEEEVSLQDIYTRKPFRSTVPFDQQVVSRITLPLAIANKYQHADPPPALTKLNVYREDGKDSMKFYTDPTYFFELWFQEIQRETDMKKREYQKKKQEQRKMIHQDLKRPKQNREQKQVKPAEKIDKYKNLVGGGMGAEFAVRNNIRHQQHNDAMQQQQQQQQRHNSNRPNSLELALEHGDTNNYNSTEIPYDRPIQQNYPNGPVSDYNNYGQRPNHQSVNNGTQNRRTSTRPQHAPPAPPPGFQSPASSSPAHRMRADSRASLPPPPPPPPGMNPVSTPSSVESGSPLHRSVMRRAPGTPDSMDLPPPPPPPPIAQSTSMSSLPPPPPSPPPPVDNGLVPPPPPPPPPMSGIGAPKQMPNGSIPAPLPLDSISVSSDSSITTTTSKVIPEPVSDGRSDLLDAIRQGFQLKKVEERKMKKEQRKTQPGVLDVQSIMDKALEMRRRALEAMDDDDDDDDFDDDDDDEWQG